MVRRDVKFEEEKYLDDQDQELVAPKDEDAQGIAAGASIGIGVQNYE